MILSTLYILTGFRTFRSCKVLPSPVNTKPRRRHLHSSQCLRSRRVVVTGLGVVSPLGVGVEKNWTRLLNCDSGVKCIRDKDKFGDIKAAAHLDEEDESHLEKQFSATDRRTLSRASLLALLAAQEAASEANLAQLTASANNGDDIGVSIGQGMVDLDYIFESLSKKKLSPFFVTRMLSNMAGGHVAIKHGLKGPNLCQSTACASGLHSIGDAFELIKRGQASAMLCGGTEAALNKIGIEAFARMRALSSRAPSDRPSRPFDLNRDGFVLGEGCGLIVLEELESALSREATIKAEVLGFGASCDANHVTQPAVEGARRSMSSALTQAELSMADVAKTVSYVNAHATSTPLGDENELRACEALFFPQNNNERRQLSISSSKGAIGHLLGASGAVELVFTIKAIEMGILTPSINVAEPMETILNIITKPTAWKDERRVAIKNSLGFGGTNASIVLCNYVPS